MPECNNENRLLEAWLADELDRESSDSFKAHLDECEECREVAALHERLQAARLDVEAPRRADLAAVRWSVLGEIRRGKPTSRSRMTRANTRLAMAALVTLAVGFGVGRETAPREELLAPSVADLESLLDGSDEFSDAPLWLSNVEVSAADQGHRKVSFDVSRRIELTRPQDDLLVRRVAVEALRTSDSLGERLATVRAIDDIDDSRVQASLVETALGDPSLAVRLAALEALRPGPEVEAGLLEILRTDPSVEMRIRAVDLLAAAQASTDEIRRALDLTDSRGAVAVLRHARSTLQL